MNMNLKKIITLLIIFALCQTQAYASPWAKKEGYFNRTGGKFVFGLKHSLFSWMSLWTESREPDYNKQWEGFSAGVGKTVIYTAGGLIQLVTFPIPVDFPDFGIGLHIPDKTCPARHAKDYVKPVPHPVKKETASVKNSPAPALKPLTTPSAPAEEIIQPKPEKKLEPVLFEAEKEIPAASSEPASKSNLKPLTTPSTSEPQKKSEAIIAEENTFGVDEAEKEKIDADKAQEEEMKAFAAAATAEKKVSEIKTVSFAEKKKEDKLPLSNDDVVSVNSQPVDDEPLWDEDDSGTHPDEESLDSDDDSEEPEDLAGSQLPSKGVTTKK